MPNKGNQGAIVSREHEYSQEAQRVVPVDVFGGVVTDGNYTVAMAYNGDNLEYVGKAQIGSAKTEAVWQIQKLTYDGSNLTDVQWADGDDAFDKVWNDRETYTYS